jgi:CheY-like chemotaxis protein
MSTKPNILVVDDDFKLRKGLSDVLQARGHIPTTAATGKEALDRVEEEKPVVALIDLKLEDMCGGFFSDRAAA